MKLWLENRQCGLPREIFGENPKVAGSSRNPPGIISCCGINVISHLKCVIKHISPRKNQSEECKQSIRNWVQLVSTSYNQCVQLVFFLICSKFWKKLVTGCINLNWCKGEHCQASAGCQKVLGDMIVNSGDAELLALAAGIDNPTEHLLESLLVGFVSSTVHCDCVDAICWISLWALMKAKQMLPVKCAFRKIRIYLICLYLTKCAHV